MPGGIALTTPTVAVPIVSTAELVTECQLKRDYFPTCTSVALYTAMLTETIAKADAWVQRRASDVYASTDVDMAQEVHDCILYRAASLVWQLIKNVMVAYDDEELPPEMVEAEQAAENRDYYAKQALEILEQFSGPGDSDDAIASTSEDREREFTQTFTDSSGAVIGDAGSMEGW